MTRFGAGVSEHPLPTHAIGEVIGQIDEKVGHRPDLAVLFAHSSLSGVLDDFVATIHAALAPRVLVGATTATVIGGRRQAEGVPAVALFAGRIDGVRPVRIEVSKTPGGIGLGGFDPQTFEGPGTLVLLADPFSFPVDGFLRDAQSRFPQLHIAGGVATGARGPGGTRFVYGSSIVTDGAVGFWCGPDAAVATCVAQGARPVGPTYTITRADGNRIIELAGRPAAERVREVVRAADARDNELMQAGLHIGLVIDEQRDDFAPGDFVVRPVVSVDAGSGDVVVGERVEIGATMQFQVIDPASARRQLIQSLRGSRARGALAFDCFERNEALFGAPNHDAEIIADALGDPALAGMGCAGEIGSINETNFTHGYSLASVLFA